MKLPLSLTKTGIVVFLLSGLTVAAEDLLLRSPLIALDSAEGSKRLWRSEGRTSFLKLVRYLTPQKNLAYCGVATSVTVLNALGTIRPVSESHSPYPFFTQENFFSESAKQIKSPEKVSKEGMSVTELGKLINAHEGAEATVTLASETTLNDFRKLAIRILGDDTRFLAVNYFRKKLLQEGGGHISPLAGYDTESDSFLILDVAQYKYPPHWVPADLLWQAMLGPVGDGSTSRGFVVIGRSEQESTEEPE